MQPAHLDFDRRGLLKLFGLAAIAGGVPAQGLAIDASQRSIIARKLPWAGVLIETRDNALFIDAVAADPARGEKAEVLAVTKPAHALITHNHGDHFSHDTVAGILGKDGLLVCQRAVFDWADRRGLRVQPVDMWQPVFFPRYGDDIVAFAVPAVDGWGVPQSSWVIDSAGVRIFHGGDTQWHGQFADIGRAYGPFDVAFLPINGARQQDGRFQDLGIPAVLTPEQAVAAAKLLHARLIVPIHYGHPDPPGYLETPDQIPRLTTAARDAGLAMRVLAVGESLTIAR